MRGRNFTWKDSRGCYGRIQVLHNLNLNNLTFLSNKGDLDTSPLGCMEQILNHFGQV